MTRFNNLPVQAPLYPDPFVPYMCLNNKSLQVTCEIDEETLKEYLKATPFEYVDNKMIISITDFTNCDKVPFMDCAIVVPVNYQGLLGGYYIFEYENNDSAIAAGRELWGYPKKYANISLEENDSTIVAVAQRNGVEIVKLSCHLENKCNSFKKPCVTPHLNMKCVPKAKGRGMELTQIIKRDTSPDFKLKEIYNSRVDVEIRGTDQDPLGDFTPLNILGGQYIVGDFYATEKNGWGEIIG